MKKIILPIIILCSTAALSSCDQKVCVCYEQVGTTMTMTDTYTDNNIACSSLTITGKRTCVEESERIDPGDIAIGKHLQK